MDLYNYLKGGNRLVEDYDYFEYAFTDLGKALDGTEVTDRDFWYMYFQHIFIEKLSHILIQD